MKILGVDPGLAILGWSILEAEGHIPIHVHYGCIRTTSSTPLSRRLVEISADFSLLLEQHQPDAIALETLFFVKNAKTLAQVGHTRGVVLLSAGERNISIFEYAPRQIKMALTGYGGAEKRQMQLVIQRRLALPSIPKPDDAADAVAVALCHLQYSQTMGKTALTV